MSPPWASAALMNVVDFHTCNSTSRNIDRPDRIGWSLILTLVKV
jgi:hypothetical protein